MKKELTIYFSIFIIMALGMHFQEWTSHPIDHLMALPKSGVFGIGAFHPFFFALILYLVILLVRAVIKVFRKK